MHTRTFFAFLVVSGTLSVTYRSTTWTTPNARQLDSNQLANQNPALRQTYSNNLNHQQPFREKSRGNNCTDDFKNSHYIRLQFERGATGNALIQIVALLATSYTFCYTPVVHPRAQQYTRYIDSIFEFNNIVFSNMSTDNFEPLSDVLSNRSQDKLSSGEYNFTLQDRSIDYNIFFSQEDFIRSSVKFKKRINQETSEYMREYFGSRSTVAIHVRRTDRIGFQNGSYVYHNLEWYTTFIDQAIGYLKSKHTNLAFIFVSDDIEWCRTLFSGPDVYFSPFRSAGNDLAVMSRCDHVILTVGTFGWCGAMLGKPKSVLYSMKYGMPRFIRIPFFLPSWIGIS